MNIFEKVAKEVGTVIAYPFVHTTKIIEILTDVLKDEPTVKTAVVGLIQQIESVVKDATYAASAGGLNLTDDVAEIVAAKALFEYVKSTFLPDVEAVYKDLAVDIKASDSTTTSTTTTAAATSITETAAAETVSVGPGLHAVTAA
jgi:hypothetical protein